MTVQQPRVLLYRDGATVQARVLGPVNCETTPFYEERLRAALAEDVRMLSLDLGEAEYLDSEGVRWLQRFQQDLERGRVGLHVAVRDGCRADRTLRLLQLDRAFRIHRYPTDPAPCRQVVRQ